MGEAKDVHRGVQDRFLKIPGIRRERLEMLFNVGGNDLLTALFHSVSESFQTRHRNISEALKRHDIEAMHKAAHSVKSSCGNLGAEELMILAQSVESSPEIDIKKTQELLNKILILQKNIQYCMEEK
jgi:HPt (histidine-containing phosphotransfer) domain-containing protein